MHYASKCIYLHLQYASKITKQHEMKQTNLETLTSIIYIKNMEIQGKTILITGGTAGIGPEAAKQFLANGAKVIITGRDQSKLDKAKKLYPAYDHN